MNGLQVIAEHEVLGNLFRIYGDQENPLFLAKDVAAWIEHSDSQKMLQSVDEGEKLLRTMFGAGQRRNTYLFSGEMTFRWVNNDNPDDCTVSHWPIAGNAADMSQAIGKALTYGNRYYLLKYFDIATSEDDPDELRRNISAGAADEAALKEMISQIDSVFKQIPAEDKEKRSAVAVAITPIIQRDTGKKSTNYLTLKTLEAAAEVFAAVQKVLGDGNG